MTPIQLAQEEAAKRGRTLTDAQADSVLWCHTGFPSFWATKPGESIEDCMRRQVGEFLDGKCGCLDCMPPRAEKKGRRL
jgi:hypothetical protein